MHMGVMCGGGGVSGSKCHFGCPLDPGGDKPVSPLINQFNSVPSILIREASNELKFKWEYKSQCLPYAIASESVILNEDTGPIFRK